MSPKWICSPRAGFPGCCTVYSTPPDPQICWDAASCPFCIFFFEGSPFCIIPFLLSRTECMHPNTIKRLKKRQILRREDRLLEWMATSPLIPGVRETNFPTGKFCRRRYDTTTVCHYFFKSESLQLS